MSNNNATESEFRTPVADALCLLADRLGAHPVTWSIGGGLARWLRGFDVAPNDIDVDTGAYYADAIFDALREFEVSPPDMPDAQRFPSTIAVYEICGARVEVIVDLGIHANDLYYQSEFSRYRDRVILLPFRGRPIPLTPLEESVLVNIVMERWETLAQIVSSPVFSHDFDYAYFRQRADEINLPYELIERLLRLQP